MGDANAKVQTGCSMECSGCSQTSACPQSPGYFPSRLLWLFPLLHPCLEVCCAIQEVWHIAASEWLATILRLSQLCAICTMAPSLNLTCPPPVCSLANVCSCQMFMDAFGSHIRMCSALEWSKHLIVHTNEAQTKTESS